MDISLGVTAVMGSMQKGRGTARIGHGEWYGEPPSDIPGL